MTEFTFAHATKEQAKLRLAIFGPSGSGKTFTALRLATGLCSSPIPSEVTDFRGKIAFIDTERGSASMYADRFEFDLLELIDKDINTYCAAIHAAQKASYAVLIIDSLTHAWQELLQEVDKLARAKYRGNTWAAWSEGTPKQRTLVNTILNYDGHVIATMRTKTEWTVEVDGKKTRPVRIGLAPMQGKGIEYEFDLLLELSPEHIANCIKDRTGKYQDKIIEMPGEELGQELAAWLMEGAKPSQKKKVETTTRTTLHWIEKIGPGRVPIADLFAAFIKDQGLSQKEALAALKVTDFHAYTGDLPSAKAAIVAAADEKWEAKKWWPQTLLDSIVKAKYAENIHNAKGMLNLSKELKRTTEPDVVMGWCEQYRAKRNENIGSGIAAEEADMQLKDEGAEEKAPSPGTPVDDEDVPF